MRNQQIERCFVRGWAGKAAISGISLAIYGIGIPVFLFFIVFKFRKSLEKPRVVASLGSTYYGYSHQYWYWEVIVKLRYAFEDNSSPQKILLGYFALCNQS